ncbi:hypothetical protein [Pseudonocardia kongjuensis]
MRRHSDLSLNQLQRISESTRVPCPPRSSRRGCGAPIGQQCVSLADGPNKNRPLGGLGAHVDRLLIARGELTPPAPDTPAPAGREPVLA